MTPEPASPTAGAERIAGLEVAIARARADVRGVPVSGDDHSTGELDPRTRGEDDA